MPDNIQVSLNVTAPSFKKIDIYGREIDLQQFKGKRVFIGFFRHAGCPFCNLRVHYLQKQYQKLQEKGLEMIFFFESKQSVLLQSTFHQEISPIPLIADPEKIIYQQYGIEQSAMKSAYSHLTGFIQTAIQAKIKGLPMHMMADGESINTIPAEFLLDENLIIRKIHYAKHLNDRMSMQIIEDWAEGKK